MGEITINPIHNVHKKYRQMNLVNPYIFAPPVDLSTNTEIGGVAATINTPALLATKLGIDVSRITNFTIIGSDIKCKITGSYTIPNDFYIDLTTNITYYNDADGLISSIGYKAFYTCRLLDYVEAKNVTSIGYQAFDGDASNIMRLSYVYTPLCVTLGTSGGYDVVFRGCFSVVFYCSPSLATNNGGTPDVDISTISTQKVTPRYVSNFTAPSAITDLNSGTIYYTAIQLNFTPPSSISTIEYYECYAGGVLKNKIIASGQYVTGLAPSTSYNITVVAVDIFLNKSVVSNSVNATTTVYATPSSYTDADANAYITAAGITGVSQESAYQLIVDLKTVGLYSKIQALYPFKGTTAAQHKFNAKNPLDTDAGFRLTFNGEATFTNNGYTPNGSTGYANSHFIPSANQAVNNNGLTVVSGTNNATIGANVFDVGAFQSVSQTTILSLKGNNTDYVKRVAVNNYLTFTLNGTNESRGTFTAVRQNATSGKLFKNRTLLASATASGSLPSIPIAIGALNQNGGYNGFSNQRFQLIIFHEGLIDAEVTTLHSIIDLSESIAGRKTW